MIKTLSIFFNSNHFLHPLQRPQPSLRKDPSFKERMAGFAFAVLSIPFTLGIMTGAYLYWAHRKVEQMKNWNLDVNVKDLFPEVAEKKSKAEILEGAVKAVQQGDAKALQSALSEYSYLPNDEEYDPNKNPFVVDIPQNIGQTLEAEAKKYNTYETLKPVLDSYFSNESFV